MSRNRQQALSNPKTQMHITGLNEEMTENHTSEKIKRSWWWKMRAWLGLLPKKVNTEKDLKMAIREENHDEVMRLLEDGVTPAAYPEVPWLCLAARRESKTMVSLLLAYGADPNVVDDQTRGSKGRTALHEAAKLGWVKGIELLMEGGANPDIVDKEGMSALYLSVKRGHVEAIRTLLTAGASWEVGSRKNQCLLHEATSAEAVTALVHAGLDPNGLDERGNAALHQQTKMGRADVIESLIYHGAHLHVQDKKRRTPIFWIGKGQSKKALDVMLQHQANLDVRDDEENTPAHAIALRCDDPETIADAYRAAPLLWDMKNRQGESPVFILSRTGKSELAEKIKADLVRQGRI